MFGCIIAVASAPRLSVEVLAAVSTEAKARKHASTGESPPVAQFVNPLIIIRPYRLPGTKERVIVSLEDASPRRL
jgi:hypothetical protein